jgi:hypothetical protein
MIQNPQLAEQLKAFAEQRTDEYIVVAVDYDGYLRFYAEMSKNLKLNMRFKVADMIYDGKLEY